MQVSRMQVSSPYSENYTIFSNLKKDDWINQLTNPDSHFFILIKEEVEQLFYKTGNFLNYLSFDDLFSLAKQVTINQFIKNMDKKSSWFFNICDDNALIYKKVKERMVNNCRNLFDSKRKINVLHLEAHLKNESPLYYEIDSSNIEDLQKIAKLEPETFKRELKNLYFYLEVDELEYLCKLGNFDMIEVLEFDPREYKYDIRIDEKSRQSYIDFSEADNDSR